jgi:hypothetical protein
VAARWLRRLGSGRSCSWLAERRKRRNPSKIGSRSGESSPCRSRSPKRQLGRWSTTASAVRREHLFDGRREAGARFNVGPISGLAPTRLGQLRIAARAQRAELWDRKLGYDRALCFRSQQGGLASVPLGASVEREEDRPLACANGARWSGRPDLNRRPHAPKARSSGIATCNGSERRRSRRAWRCPWLSAGDRSGLL